LTAARSSAVVGVRDGWVGPADSRRGAAGGAVRVSGATSSYRTPAAAGLRLLFLLLFLVLLPALASELEEEEDQEEE
jgi:hypothetical protein